MENDQVKLAVMSEKINNIDKNVNAIGDKLDKNYVTIDRYALIQDKVERLEKIIYGVIAAILATMVAIGFSFFKK